MFNQMPQISRRQFLKRTFAASTVLSLPARLHSAANGANDDIRVAVVGIRSRGQDHLKNYISLRGVRVVAVCDVDGRVLEEGVARLKTKGVEAKPYRDIRALLDSKEVDAVSIATPNHWHALGGIWAIQAGKDVYVEKPVSHNVWEGRQLVSAAEKHRRIVQMGVQSRSGAGIAAALEWVKSEPLGKLRLVRGLCYNPRPSIGLAGGEQPIPQGLDYDQWCGPAPMTAPRRNNPKNGPVHYDWHWTWNYGNGDLGNQGIHQMDIARRFLGEAGHSRRVFAAGGRLGYKDDGETPNSLFVYHDYAKASLIFEVRGLPKSKTAGEREMDKIHGVAVGVVSEYEHGYIICPDYWNAAAYDSDGKLLRKFGDHPLWKDVPETNPAPSDDPKAAPANDENHYANFIAAVRSGNPGELKGSILDGHISSALCHTANISYLLGKKLSPDLIREKFLGNREAVDCFDRLAANMAANEVDLKVDQLTLGEFLNFDPQAEQFIDHPSANALLTRECRTPYVVPSFV
ncbi:MAG: Gfo/Idh/MocA family oxidoreductase [Verrucomicrobiota bacterium]